MQGLEDSLTGWVLRGTEGIFPHLAQRYVFTLSLLMVVQTPWRGESLSSGYCLSFKTSVLYFLSPYSYIFSIPPFPFLLSFAPSHSASTLLISHPLYSVPLLHLCPSPSTSPPSFSTSVPWLCLPFHTSVYTPRSLVPLRPSLPRGCVQPYMVREHHGSLVVRAQEIPRNYPTLTVGGREVVRKTD